MGGELCPLLVWVSEAPAAHPLRREEGRGGEGRGGEDRTGQDPWAESLPVGCLPQLGSLSTPSVRFLGYCPNDLKLMA